jgi:Anti-sigma-K factor rskA
MTSEHAGSDDAVVRYLSGDRDAPLSDADRADLAALDALLADPSLWAEPPAELEDRVVAAVSAAAAAEGVREADEFPPAPVDLAAARATRGGEVPPLRRARNGAARPSVWRRPQFLIAAAAAVVAVAITSVLLLQTGPAQARFEAALVATELSPGASGNVTMTRTDSGWDIRLTSSGLPRLDNGQFYQAWLRNEAGVLVPIGTFNEGQNVILWAGVSPADFPTLTITKELADGNQASSGQRVLVGTAVPR